MKALKRMESTAVPQGPAEENVIRFPVPADRARAARILSDFTTEARGIVSRLDEALGRTEASRPGDRARREVLRFLADQEDWVDLHDIPPAGNLGRSGTRSLVHTFAEHGLVEVERNATYPNMTFLRVTPAGRESLRQMGVAEAMGYLRGSDGRIEAAVEDALRALRRAAEVIG
jgi:hypothetical protein